MGCSDSLLSFPPHFVSFAWQYHTCVVISSLPSDHNAGLWARGLSCRFPHSGLIVDVETKGSLRFLGNPYVHALPFSDPGGTEHARPISACRCCLPQLLRRRLPQNLDFRGSITRPAHSLSTLRSMSHPITTQDSLPAAGQLYRVGLVTHWVPLKGFNSS